MAVKIASVIFDAQQRILKKGSLSRNLEPKVFNLLTTLLAANGQIVTRDQLIVQVWNNRIVGEGAINRTVSLLRAHFLALTDEEIIETIPTQGYRLVAPVIDIDVDIVNVSAEVINQQSIEINLDLNQHPTEIEQSSVNKDQLDTQVPKRKTNAFITIMVLMLLALLGYFYQTERVTTKNTLSLVSNPLIGLKGWEYQLSVTDSGEQILFHHLSQSNQQSIYLYDINNHTKRMVLNNALAAINGDGELIVYSTNSNNQCSIAIYHVLTARKQALFDCNEPPTAFIWGENDTFYFNKRFSKSHPYQVFSYNVNTSQLKQITHPSSNNNTKGDFRFAYNKHTDQLAIIRYINEKKSKIIITHNAVPLAEYTVDLRLNSLVWHPNKNALIIADNTNLYSLTIADILPSADSLTTVNNQYQLLKQLEININSLAVITTKTGASLLVSSANFTSEIVKYTIENHQQVVWQHSARAELLPRMQADTQLVLSTRYKGHHWWQIQNDDATFVDVTLPFDLQFVRYELSNDGKRVLFTKYGTIYELDLEKANYAKVFVEPSSSYVANYDSRNNNDMIYSSNHSGQWQLWHYQRASDKHSQLTQRGGYSGRIVGPYLYYSKFTMDGLWRKQITDTTEVAVAAEELVIEDFNRINWLNWQVINNQIYFYREASGIWQYDIATSTEQLLMPKPDNFVHQYSVSPDQKDIFWVRLKPVEGDIYQYAF